MKIQEKELEADYEIGVVLGNGGFGTVYAGTRRRDGKRVSLRDTLRIFTSTLYGKTKTNTDPNPNRYRRRCPDPNAMIQKKELQIKTEEDGNFKAEKYKIEIEVNILNTTLIDSYTVNTCVSQSLTTTLLLNENFFTVQSGPSFQIFSLSVLFFHLRRIQQKRLNCRNLQSFEI